MYVVRGGEGCTVDGAHNEVRGRTGAKIKIKKDAYIQFKKEDN